ncbi:MAG: hypothetical protein U5L07_02670 [Desulfobacterales bacterium]|nr:hypothetical protein [Desulfobacterales bacterium]
MQLAKNPIQGKNIITGSQQFNVRDALNQSLAGRIGILPLFENMVVAEMFKYHYHHVLQIERPSGCLPPQA